MNEKQVINFEDFEDNIEFLMNSSKVGFYFNDKDGKRKYFKSEGRHCSPNNEVLVDILFQELEMPNVNHKKATYINKRGVKYEGVISNDYKSQYSDYEVMAFGSLDQIFSGTPSLDRIKERIGDFVYIAHPDKELVYSKGFDLFYKKLSLIFYLTAQVDTLTFNYEFLVEVEKDKIYFAHSPFFDNSISFYKSLERPELHWALAATRKHYLKSKYKPALLMRREHQADSNNQALFKEIYDELKKDSEFRAFYSKVLKLDFAKAIEKHTQGKENKKVSRRSKKLAVECFETSRAILSENLIKLKQKDINDQKIKAYNKEKGYCQ